MVDGESTEIYAAPFPGPGPLVRISTTGAGGTDGDRLVQFSPDGKQVLYVDAGQRLVAVDVAVLGDRLQIGASHPLFPIGTVFPQTLDGRRFLASPQRGNDPLTIV